jgi:hypothetical protein
MDIGYIVYSASAKFHPKIGKAAQGRKIMCE